MKRFFECSRFQILGDRIATVALWFLATMLLPSIGTAQSPAGKDTTALRGEMHSVYRSFSDLLPYIYQEEKFFLPENEEKIHSLLVNLSENFQTIQEQHAERMNEPGFASTLQVLNDLLNDAKNRFDEGKKGYALWRLRTTSNHCISCHSRYEVKTGFDAGERAPESLSAYQRGEFYLASRQFDRARDEFLASAGDPTAGSQRLEALRKWLVIETRIDPDPKQALATLSRVRKTVPFNPYEDDEIRGWVESLERWNKEGNPRGTAMQQAESLISRGLQPHDLLAGKKGEVELLRATAILHRLLDSKQGAGSERRHALYLLGLAYSELPFFFVNELPELFLEQDIREYPGTADAKNSYALYRKTKLLGYTGSSGTKIPSDVQLKLDELRAVAYGVPRPVESAKNLTEQR